jgi:hypothetical protein
VFDSAGVEYLKLGRELKVLCLTVFVLKFGVYDNLKRNKRYW